MNQDMTKKFSEILEYLEKQLGDVDPNDPNWSIKQSHMTGQRHMLNTVRGMLNYE